MALGISLWAAFNSYWRHKKLAASRQTTIPRVNLLLCCCDLQSSAARYANLPICSGNFHHKPGQLAGVDWSSKPKGLFARWRCWPWELYFHSIRSKLALYCALAEPTDAKFVLVSSSSNEFWACSNGCELTSGMHIHQEAAKNKQTNNTSTSATVYLPNKTHRLSGRRFFLFWLSIGFNPLDKLN